MADKEHLKAQLEALRRNFIAQLPKRLVLLQEGLHKLRETGSDAELAEFHRVAHSLTGAGATFGCQALSDAARVLETQLVSPAAAADVAQLEILLADVSRVAEQAMVEGATEAELPMVPSLRPAERRIFILEDEDECRRNLEMQLEHFGYQIESFASGEALIEAAGSRVPAVIIADIVIDADTQGGIDAVKVINAGQVQPIPALFLSSRTDFEARLEAVRAHGKAFFPKPVAIEALVDMVDELISEAESQPYSVLVVDDSESQAQFYANILAQAGMATRVVNDPMQVLDVIDEYSPELVLMDMYMPDCSGVELAAVIRQQPAHLGIPIVFLSSETDRQLQLNAMSLGGDDFLTKPINPVHLIASVAIRAGRYRIIRSRMSQDSLTGLLNHRRLMEGLHAEVARSRRYGGQLAFAMLDIDHFKKVNDTYGHATGDRVIKRLARLLKQRLRSTDIIGRYGGEEFAVIMPETPLEAAAKMMRQIGEDFAGLIHHAGDQSFHVTLSGGVVGLTDKMPAGELRETADQLLYQAKHNGRNQIACAGENS